MLLVSATLANAVVSVTAAQRMRDQMKGCVDAARHGVQHSNLMLYPRVVEGGGFLCAAISEKTGPYKAIGLRQELLYAAPCRGCTEGTR